MGSSSRNRSQRMSEVCEDLYADDEVWSIVAPAVIDTTDDGKAVGDQILLVTELLDKVRKARLASENCLYKQIENGEEVTAADIDAWDTRWHRSVTDTAEHHGGCGDQNSRTIWTRRDG